MSNSWVCIDSNAVTYLVEAVMTGKCPADALATEKIALLRTYLYRAETLYISPEVKAECSKIRGDEWLKLHLNLGHILLGDLLEPDLRELEIRIGEYRQLHNGDRNLSDCRIVAEAELGGCEYLLTCDGPLIAKLDGRTHGIRLLTPKAFWSSLNLPHGSELVRSPHHTNPLLKEMWWKW